MKRKKTTMLPQIYKIFKDPKLVDSTESIYNKNKESSEHVLKLRENGKFNVQTDFVELVHHISPIPDFISIPDENSTYSILDMPGLNCGGDTLYYDYIKKISNTIDIYLLVFDINSGLNTTDEINIIQLVVEQIQKNSNGYVHVLINKCDDIQFDGNKIELEDPEDDNDMKYLDNIIEDIEDNDNDNQLLINHEDRDINNILVDEMQIKEAKILDIDNAIPIELTKVKFDDIELEENINIELDNTKFNWNINNIKKCYFNIFTQPVFSLTNNDQFMFQFDDLSNNNDQDSSDDENEKKLITQFSIDMQYLIEEYNSNNKYIQLRDLFSGLILNFNLNID